MARQARHKARGKQETKFNKDSMSASSAPLAEIPSRLPAWQQGVFLGSTFLGSFLLFQVQPLIGKLILPWFGGTAAVWTICLLFFQAALFAGYAYAHLSSRWLTVPRQVMVHALLLVATLMVLPIVPDAAQKPQASVEPAMDVLRILATTVGLPFFLLSTTAPLVQRWWTLVESASPYRLYALSNVGSLLALLTYSFVVERVMGTTLQAYVWSFLYLGLFLLLATCMGLVWRNNGSASAEEMPEQRAIASGPSRIDVKAPSWLDRTAWLGLAALGTTVLMSVSNFLCQDVSSVPFLWVAPLTLYLLTFILCFGQSSWYSRKWFLPLMLLGTSGVATAYMISTSIRLVPLLAITLFGLFVVCMVCHGELERRKPDPQHLTEFYLFLSAGGMVGGLFVGIVAPLTFNEYYELPLAMIGVTLFGLWLIFRTPASPLYRGKRLWAWGLLLLIFGDQVYRWSNSVVGRHYSVLAVQRNFYGVLKIMIKVQGPNLEKPYLSLLSGLIEHGGQYLEDPELQKIPTSYYGRRTGFGRAFELLDARNQRRVGLVGLGTGTGAAYGKQGDYFRFYEINPAVIPLAQEQFTYLQDFEKRGGKYEIALGDARLSLENEPPQKYDLLVLDAFAGDSIPVHLLTREAMELYLRHLRSDGILAVHISNRYLDLMRVIRDLGRHFDLEMVQIATLDEPKEYISACNWLLFARRGQIRDARIQFKPSAFMAGPTTIWTDDRSSLLEVIR